MKDYLQIDIDSPISVSHEMVEKARRLEDDPEMIMRLVDLIFLFRDEGKDIPS